MCLCAEARSEAASPSAAAWTISPRVHLAKHCLSPVLGRVAPLLPLRPVWRSKPARVSKARRSYRGMSGNVSCGRMRRLFAVSRLRWREPDGIEDGHPVRGPPLVCGLCRVPSPKPCILALRLRPPPRKAEGEVNRLRAPLKERSGARFSAECGAIPSLSRAGGANAVGARRAASSSLICPAKIRLSGDFRPPRHRRVCRERIRDLSTSSGRAPRTRRCR